MHPTASRLSPEVRTRICEALDLCLADGVDLYTQVKNAHWNVKGPHFASLHPLFDSIASSVLEHNDVLAERAVALGATVHGTARRAAKASRLAESSATTTDGLEHVKNLTERFATALDGLRSSRDVANEHGDLETGDIVIGTIEDYEKHAWFLHATLTR